MKSRRIALHSVHRREQAPALQYVEIETLWEGKDQQLPLFRIGERDP